MREVIGTWEDATSYSQNEKQPRTPRAWQYKFPSGLRVLIHKHRDYEPDVWLLTCHRPDLCDLHALTEKNIEQAKVEAFQLIIGRLNAIRLDVEAAI